MQTNKLKQPVLIYMYGAPGSGKTFVSRQISEMLGMAHISSERLRYELFQDPMHDKTEIGIINQLMAYMTEEFLKVGVSVMYDTSVSRKADRKILKELARKNKAKDMMIWMQVDQETAWGRNQKRDMRKSDDKYAEALTPELFEQYVRIMQNPQNEDCLVLSGKHLFNSHKQAILRRLTEMNLFNIESLQRKVAKPGMVNLVSRAKEQAGRVDYSRRNISIQ